MSDLLVEENRVLKNKIEVYRGIVRDLDLLLKRAADLLQPMETQAVIDANPASASASVTPPPSAASVTSSPVQKLARVSIDWWRVGSAPDALCHAVELGKPVVGVCGATVAGLGVRLFGKRDDERACEACEARLEPEERPRRTEGWSALAEGLKRAGVTVSLPEIATWPEMLRLSARAWLDQGATEDGMPPALAEYKVSQLQIEAGKKSVGEGDGNGHALRHAFDLTPELPAHVVPELGSHPSRTDAEMRAKLVVRARSEGLLPAEGPIDEAWVELQYKAPAGWFARARGEAPSVVSELSTASVSLHASSIEAPKRKGRPRKGTPRCAVPACGKPLYLENGAYRCNAGHVAGADAGLVPETPSVSTIAETPAPAPASPPAPQLSIPATVSPAQPPPPPRVLNILELLKKSVAETKPSQ